MTWRELRKAAEQVADQDMEVTFAAGSSKSVLAMMKGEDDMVIWLLVGLTYINPTLPTLYGPGVNPADVAQVETIHRVNL